MNNKSGTLIFIYLQKQYYDEMGLGRICEEY